MFSEKNMETAIGELLRALNETEPAPIGAMFAFELLHCDPEADEVLFRCKTLPWMCNTVGVLHGGMGAAVLDQAMSYVARAVKPDHQQTATIQLQVYYHHPIIPGEELQVIVRKTSRSRSLMHFSSEVIAGGKLCLSGTAMFYLK